MRTLDIIRVGIRIRDLPFAKALVRGLSRECRNMNFLLDRPEEGDIILTDSEPPAEFRKDRYVYLVRDQVIAGDRPDLLFRYEDCRTMVNRLTYVNYLLTGRNLEFRGTSAFRSLSFISGAGGAGVTSLCISAGRMLSILYGCHCLYVPLSPLDGAGRYMGRVDGQDLQRLFYQLETKEQVPLGTYIVSDGYLDRLRTPLINHYVTELDGEILGKLMAVVNELGQYDFVLVDIGTMFAGGALDLLRNSDGIVYVRDGSEDAETGILEEIARTLDLSEIHGIRVWNMRRERGNEDEEEITIGMYRQAFVQEGEVLSIDLNTSYGADVAVLCEKIMGEYDNG